MGFLGEYEVSVDAKGRFLMPAGFRKQLPEGAGESFVVSRGLDNCLSLYTMADWNKLNEKLVKLNEFNPKSRAFVRTLLSGATIVELDSAGRINLPNSLMLHASIKKEMVFAAQGNKVELWDKDTYHEYLRVNAASFSDLAAEVAGGDFMSPF